MHTRLKFFLLCGHFFALAATLFWVFQGVNPVYEKGLVAILIFITLNLIRLFQKENRNDSNDQF
jgi:membrane protein implicated in regulation of membrane protease activity